MSASIHSLPNNGRQEPIEARLRRALKEQKVKIGDLRISHFMDWHASERKVFLLDADREQPLVLFGSGVSGRLLGNAPVRTLPMRITSFRTGSRSFRPILNCGAFDAISIEYFGEEIGFLMDAEFFLGRRKW